MIRIKGAGYDYNTKIIIFNSIQATQFPPTSWLSNLLSLGSVEEENVIFKRISRKKYVQFMESGYQRPQF